MTEKIIVYADPFHESSPRMRQLEAERVVAKVLGPRKPSLFRRALAWLGIKKGN